MNRPWVRGDLIADAALIGALHQPQLIMQQVVAHLAGSERITRHAFAQHLRHRAEWYLELAAPTVGFDHADLQITAIAGLMQIINDEIARRHRGRIDQLLVLPDFHLGIGVRDTEHHRRVATQCIGNMRSSLPD
ncbi:hypothetical protein D3C81_1229460 [compost metagenome]